MPEFIASLKTILKEGLKMSEQRILTSESVGRGHPDKVCDSISDAVLDEVILNDPRGRVALETAVKGGFPNKKLQLTELNSWKASKYGVVTLLGEITTNYTNLYIQGVVEKAIKKIGYVHEEEGFNFRCLVLPFVSRQSPDIAMGVDSSEAKEQGAGDQGLMWGYATNETQEFMPLGLVLAHKLVKRLEETRESGKLSYLRPDTKSQVAVLYDSNGTMSLKNVVVAASHDSKVEMEQLRRDVLEEIIKPVCENWLTPDTTYHINATGRFEVHGPVGDSGVTGRKIIVDTYGGVGRHGGGAFSGKDPSKVDRSAAYLARYISKNIVAAGLADVCELQLSYCIGVAEPTSVQINTYGTGRVPDTELVEAVREVMPLKPAEIIKAFKLTKPEGWCYYDTAAYGHFGNDKYPWEKTDRVEDLFFVTTR